EAAAGADVRDDEGGAARGRARDRLRADAAQGRFEEAADLPAGAGSHRRKLAKFGTFGARQVHRSNLRHPFGATNAFQPWHSHWFGPERWYSQAAAWALATGSNGD